MSSIKDKIVDKITNQPSKEEVIAKIREDMFYDMLSSSGFSREEVDEMYLLPEELSLEEWTMDEFIQFMAKWFSKTTRYYVEYNKEGEQFEFSNPIATMLGNLVAVTEKAKELKDSIAQETFKLPLSRDTIDKDLNWATRYVLDNLENIPPIKLPDIEGPIVVRR